MSEVTEEYIGLDKEDGVLIVSPDFYNTILLSTTNLGSDRSALKLENGEVMMIGGIKVMMAPFLGRTYSAGALDKDEAFDFQGANVI